MTRHSFAVIMIEYISSRKNQIISHVRHLTADRAYRHECGEYVCDGIKLLKEALKWGAEIKTVLWAGEPELELPETVRQYRASSELLDYASALKNCPGVLFTAAMKNWNMSEPGRTLVLETIQDPGNLGTILRTANALNMDSVILTGDCADLYNAKTVRAAMGALFRQRVYSMEREELRRYLDKHGLKLYGAALSDKSKNIRELDLSKTAVAIGSEGRGLSSELLAMCNGELIIPMNTACESLNAGIAAAIVMWELSKR